MPATALTVKLRKHRSSPVLMCSQISPGGCYSTPERRGFMEVERVPKTVVSKAGINVVLEKNAASAHRQGARVDGI